MPRFEQEHPQTIRYRRQWKEEVLKRSRSAQSAAREEAISRLREPMNHQIRNKVRTVADVRVDEHSTLLANTNEIYSPSSKEETICKQAFEVI